MPLVFWVFLRDGYELPKWFLWRWGMVLIFLFAKQARNDKTNLPFFVYTWLAFFFFSLLSLGEAIDLQAGFLNIANLFLGLTLFLFVSVRLKDFEIKNLVPFLILPALPVAVYGIFQAFGCDFISLTGPFRGAISTFGHRNFVAEYELMVLPLLLYGGFFGFDKSNPYVFKNVVRGFSLASLPIVYAHFIITHTRGSYVALIAALVFIIIFVHTHNDNWKRCFVGAVILLILLTGFFFVRNYNLAGERVIGGRNEILRQKTPQNDNFTPAQPPSSPEASAPLAQRGRK
jgi:hypothetical protein